MEEESNSNISSREQKLKKNKGIFALAFLLLVTGARILRDFESTKDFLKTSIPNLVDSPDVLGFDLGKNNTTHHLINYPCFPDRLISLEGSKSLNEFHNSSLTTVGQKNQHRQASTIIYLFTAWKDLHSETFYTFIHYLCSCDDDKHILWKIDSNVTPNFYIGPEKRLTDGFKRVLRELNVTACGPIIFGSPMEEPDLTIYTTAYKRNFDSNDPFFNETFPPKLNDRRYLFICHDDAPFLENASNVFFLTPAHENHVIPSFFPPIMVDRGRQIKKQYDQTHPPPIFLVLGSFANSKKRHVESLSYAYRMYQNKSFTLRFMGGTSENNSIEDLNAVLQRKFWVYDNLTSTHQNVTDRKVELIPHLDSYEFMMHVTQVDAILPLVDETNFYKPNGYQGGKKLSSSISWGLGFGKKMVLYRPLADFFGIQEDNETYWLHGNGSESFSTAFGHCLDYISRERSVL